MNFMRDADFGGANREASIITAKRSSALKVQARRYVLQIILAPECTRKRVQREKREKRRTDIGACVTWRRSLLLRPRIN